MLCWRPQRQSRRKARAARRRLQEATWGEEPSIPSSPGSPCWRCWGFGARWPSSTSTSSTTTASSVSVCEAIRRRRTRSLFGLFSGPAKKQEERRSALLPIIFYFVCVVWTQPALRSFVRTFHKFYKVRFFFSDIKTKRPVFFLAFPFSTSCFLIYIPSSRFS